MATILTRRIEDLKPHENNAIINNDKADASLVKSISEKGILTPLLITKDNIIISGHRRLDAAIICNYSDIPVTIFPSEDPLEIRSALVESNNNRVKIECTNRQGS